MSVDYFDAVDQLRPVELVEYPALASYVERYQNLTGVPLIVTLTLRPGSRLAGYDQLNLDNLLAWAVVQEATKGEGVPSIPGCYRLPVPLRTLWRSPDGVPLYACTSFVPQGQTVKDVHYWHKRMQTGRWTGTKTGNFSIRSTNGRYMERRTPLPVLVGREWTARAVGDPQEIARLLEYVVFAGKKRAHGHGEVESWRIEPAGGFRLVEDGLLTRNLPGLAVGLLGGAVPVGEMAPIAYTPPQWKAPLWAVGWWAGTIVEGRAREE